MYAPELDAAQRHELAVAKVLGAFPVVLIYVTQLRALLQCGWMDLGKRLLSVATMGVMALWPLAAPHNFLRWRHWGCGAHRVSFFLMRWLRERKGVQLALDGAASVGITQVACIRDVVRIAWGSRAITVAMTALAMPLPLLPHCLVMAFSLLMVRDNAVHCQARLLKESAGCIRAFHSFMGALTPTTGDLLPGQFHQVAMDQQVACSTFLDFMLVVVIFVLPMLLVPRIQTLRSVSGWVRDLDALESLPGRVLRALCCGPRRGQVRMLSGTQIWVCRWLIIHFIWTVAVLPAT